MKQYKINWTKVPEVVPGGKQYFYTAETPIGRFWIVWDRVRKNYVVQDESYYAHGQYRHLVNHSVRDIKEGKLIVQLIVDNY